MGCGSASPTVSATRTPCSCPAVAGPAGPRVGPGRRSQAGVLPARLAELAPSCRWIASVCTGAMLLAAAGLTSGRRVTTHHDALNDLRASGAQLVDGARVVDDGDLITAAGMTAGLDLALWIVERSGRVKGGNLPAFSCRICRPQPASRWNARLDG